MRQTIVLEREDVSRLKQGEVLTLVVGGQSIGLQFEVREKIMVADTVKKSGHECEYCGAKYKLRGNMYYHRATNHSEMAKLKCKKCDSKFFEPRGLMSHNLRKHGEKIK